MGNAGTIDQIMDRREKIGIFLSQIAILQNKGEFHKTDLDSILICKECFDWNNPYARISNKDILFLEGALRNLRGIIETDELYSKQPHSRELMENVVALFEELVRIWPHVEDTRKPSIYSPSSPSEAYRRTSS